MKRNGLEALNFQHKMNYNRNTNFEYTTETIMFYTRCYMQCGFNLQILIRKINPFVLFFVGESIYI